MAFNNPYTNPNNQFQSSAAPYAGPQSYVNFTMPNNYSYPYTNNGLITRFVNSEQEAASMPNPTSGCAFYVDGEKLVLYAKYADGRPMEVYDMVLREAPKAPEYLTVDQFNKLMDSKMDELSKKFVIRKERNNG